MQLSLACRAGFASRLAAAIAPLAVAAFFGSAAFAQQKPSIAGDYTARGNPTFTSMLHLKLGTDGTLSGSMDLPDEHEMGDVLKDIQFDGVTLKFSVTGHTGSWVGALSSDGSSLKGKWNEWGVSTASTFTRDELSAVTGSSPVDGIWLGSIPAGATQVRIQVIVKTDVAGQLSCTMDSPDQRVMAILCAHAAFTGDNFSFDIPAVSANWYGKLSADGNALTGTLTEGDAVALNFQRQSVALAATPVSARPFDAAVAPVDAAGLQPVLDRDLAEALKTGELAPTTGVGVTIGVIRGGVERIFSYGAAKPDSIFEIGSTTKTFTGLMLAQMVAQGKAKLDEPVRELLPPGTVAKPDGVEITLLDLATRRSGLPRFPSNIDMAATENPYANYHAVDLYAFLRENGVAKTTALGGLAYSDLGFGVLGQALADRAGMSYPALLKEEIAGPLGLDDTTIALTPAQQLRFLTGTNGADHRLAHALDFDALAGAGAIRSTAADMLNYVAANLHPESVKPVAGFANSATISTALAMTHELQGGEIKPGMRIALAWLYQTETGNYWHNGATAGFSSYVFFNPQGDYGGVVLLNASPEVDDSFVDRLGEHISERLAGKPAISLGP